MLQSRLQLLGLLTPNTQSKALARLVYTRCSIAILDDSFSALDSRTSSQVIQNLLGPGGLLRQDGRIILWLNNNGNLPSITHLHGGCERYNSPSL